MFNLLPKDTVFFDLFENLVQHVVTSAKQLQRLVAEFPKIEPSLQMIRNEEHEADNLAHQALDRLDRTFITPFDREDIHTLVGNLDDIIDAGGGTDPLEVLKWKELYDYIEEAIDGCEDVGNTLERIVLKNG